MSEKWITTAEAANLLGVTIAHVNHLLRDGYIKGKKFGRFWMVDRISVETYAAQEPGPKPKSKKET